MRTTYGRLGMAVALLLVLACSTAAPAPSRTATAVPTAAVTAGAAPAAGVTAPVAAASAQSDWDRLKEAAKREGRVVIAGPGFPGLRNGLAQGFERAYGLAVEYVGLGGAEIIARVDGEARAGRPTIDVTLGGFTGCWTMAERDQLEDVTTALLDPSVLNPAAWRGGRLKYIQPSPNLPPDFSCAL